MFKKIITFIIVLFICIPSYATELSQVSINNNNKIIRVHDNLSINVNLKSLPNVYALRLKISYDPSFLKPNSSKINLSNEITNKQHFVGLNAINPTEGQIDLIFTILGNEEELNENTQIGNISFECLKKGITNISILSSKIVDRNCKIIKHENSNLEIKIENALSNKKTDISKKEQLSNYKPSDKTSYIQMINNMSIIDNNYLNNNPNNYVNHTQINSIINSNIFKDKLCSNNTTCFYSSITNNTDYPIDDTFSNNTFINRGSGNYINRIELVNLINNIIDNTINHSIIQSNPTQIQGTTLNNNYPNKVYLSNYMKALNKIRHYGLVDDFITYECAPYDLITTEEICKILYALLQKL